MAGTGGIYLSLFTLLCLSSSLNGQRPRHPDHHDDRVGGLPGPDQEARNNSTEKYLVVLPKVLISGSSEVVCITIYEMEQPVQITMSMPAKQAELLDFFMEFPHICVEITIPEIDTTSEKVMLFFQGFQDNGQGSLAMSISDTKFVQIQKARLETFIETDKPIYKPGQTVKFRVLTLDQNLRTITSPVDKIWVETPSGIRIAQWLSVPGKQGLVDLELPMTSDPMMGNWKIKVEHHDMITESVFKVDEYVLPKFEVTVEGPSYILINETSIQYTICGRYTYGQPVIGAVEAQLIPEFNYAREEVDSISFTADNTGSSGCVEATFDLRDWSLRNNYYSLYNSKLKLTADFTEIVTGVSISAEDEGCKITNIIYDLNFIGTKKYKKGLPFATKVKVTTPDGAPAAGIPVQVTMTTGGSYLEEEVTDQNGIAVFHVDFVEQSAIFLQAEVPSLSNQRYHPREHQVQADTDTANYRTPYSPSNTYLQIGSVSGKLAVGSGVTIPVSHTGSGALNSRDIRAVFMSRGNLVRPSVQFTDSRPVGEGDGQRYNEFHMQFIVTQEMVPITKLLVYFVQDDEVVADSIVFNVQKSLENEVEIAFTSDEERPGEETWIDISAAPDSLCGVGVVDKSVHLLGGGSNNIRENQVWKYLEGTQLGAGSGASNDRCGSPDFSPWGFQRGSTPEADASAAFNDAGLLYLTNLDLETAPCPRYPAYQSGRFHMMARGDGLPGPRGIPMAMPMAMDDVAGEPEIMVEESSQPDSAEPPRLRSYFPETWLWELVPVKGNGRGYVNMTVPDTITEWVGSGFCISESQGIGISSTSRLQAFQPFFVSYTLPYSVIRNENFPAKVTVFNYMSDCLVVELTLSESENFTIEENEDRVKSVCVCGSQSASVEFNIIPNVLGMMPIKVTAESIADDARLCGNDFVATLQSAGDSIQKEILVEAEGIEREVTQSEFFCLTESNPDFPWSVSVQPPEQIVPETAWAKLTFTGDVMGTTLSNLDSLVQVPYGCGEQNMITFVPNVLAMKYLTATDQLTPDVAKPATDNMKLGYQREFNYRHDDGSFSAFGKSDASGSTWLTAFVVRSFYQASSFIDVDFDDLSRSIDWLKGLQAADGCFRSVGKLCHKDMAGGVNNNLTLSAYVVISLLEAGEEPQDPSIVKGLQCLERQVGSSQDTYALAQVAYALALADRPMLGNIMTRLQDLAVVEGGKHWVSSREDPSGGPSHYHHAITSADVEITSYVLMTCMVSHSPAEVIARGLQVSRWLARQRNSRGGFGSTQDTVIGLTALSRFAEYTASGEMNISLVVESSQSQAEWGTRQELRATNEDRLVLRQLYMDDVPTEVQATASGTGCGLMQVSWFYNEYPEEPELPQFELSVEIQDNNNLDCSRFLVEVCTSYTGADGASNMAVVDFRFQSGYVADKETLDALKANFAELKRYELDGKSVLFYFDELTDQVTCVQFSMMQDVKVKETKPSFATVYDYYKTHIQKTVTYALECSIEKPEFPGLGLLPAARVNAWGDVAAIQLRLGGPPVEDVIGACPECVNNRMPDDWERRFCESDRVMTVKFRTDKFKLFDDYRHGQVSIDTMVDYQMDDSCDCGLEDKTRYIVFTDSSKVDLDARELTVDGAMLIMPFRGKYIRRIEAANCDLVDV